MTLEASSSKSENQQIIPQPGKQLANNMVYQRSSSSSVDEEATSLTHSVGKSTYQERLSEQDDMGELDNQDRTTIVCGDQQRKAPSDIAEHLNSQEISVLSGGEFGDQKSKTLSETGEKLEVQESSTQHDGESVDQQRKTVSDCETQLEERKITTQTPVGEFSDQKLTAVSDSNTKAEKVLGSLPLDKSSSNEIPTPSHPDETSPSDENAAWPRNCSKTVEQNTETLLASGSKPTKQEQLHPNDRTDNSPNLLDQIASKKSLFAQCLMNGAVTLLVIGSGMPIGFSAVLLPQLQAPESTMPTDEDWASWIASVHSVMTPVGSVLAGPLMDRLGRRCVLLLSILPMVSGWLIMSTATAHLSLAAGRMLAGFAVGMVPGPSQVLIGEVSEPHLRGVFSSAASIAYALGILIVYALGSVLPWRMVAALCLLLPLTGLVLVLLPESPVWLVNRGYTDKARKSLLWLRGGDHQKVNLELHILVMHHKAEEDRRAMASNDDVSCQMLPEQLTCLNRPEVFKPFFIIFIFCLLQILSGSYVVIFYGVKVISSASGNSETDIHSLTIAVMTALVRFVVSIVTTVCLLKLGRRKIGIISGIGTSLACFTLVGFLQLKNHNVIQLKEDLNFVVIATLIMIYVALNTFGIFGLPCMMIGEVLPSSVRGFVSGMLLTVVNLMVFLSTKLYPFVADLLGPSGVFLVFAIVAAITSVYLYLFLPETKDRPLTQIEEYFTIGKNYLWSSRDKTQMAKKKPFV